jgi:microcystin-dependent protein
MAEGFIGEIRLWAPSRIPLYWLACQGQKVDIATYQSLYSVIGTQFGGDGTTTFGLPDLSGRVPVGQGAGAGLTPRQLGQTFGAESYSLAASELPTHSHQLSATTTTASTNVPGPTVILAAGTNTTSLVDSFYAPPGSTGFSTQQMAASAIVSAGSNLPHENRMPMLGLNFIICYNGTYPPRN